MYQYSSQGQLVPVGLGSPNHPLWVLDPSMFFEIVLDPPASPNEAQFQRLRYIGPRNLCAALDCALSVQEPTVGAVGYEGALTKNGAVIPNSPMDAQTGGLITSADSLSFKGGALLEPGDTIQVLCANLTTTDPLIVSAGHLQVVGFFVG